MEETNYFSLVLTFNYNTLYKMISIVILNFIVNELSYFRYTDC